MVKLEKRPRRITIKQKILIFLTVIVSLNFFVLFLMNNNVVNYLYTNKKAEYVESINNKIKLFSVNSAEFKRSVSFYEEQDMTFIIINKANYNIEYSSFSNSINTISTEEFTKILNSNKSLGYIVPSDKVSEDWFEDNFHAKSKLTVISENSVFYIIGQIPYSDIEYSNDLFNVSSLISIFIIMLLGVFPSMFFSWKITKPLNQIAAVSKKIENKDFSVRCPITTSDEISDVAKSINSMANSLESYNKKIVNSNKKLRNDILNKKQVEESQKSFISNMSHEIKTPIAIISGYAEAMKAGLADSEESRNEYCDIIIDECSRMSSLVHQLLDLARAENKDMKLNYSTFCINELCDSIIKPFALRCSSHNITIKKDYYITSDVCADIYEIQKVITNYMQNAVKHTPDGGSITVTIRPDKQEIYIGVKNSGSHIEESDLVKIWDKFYKIDKSHTREDNDGVESTGLGLSIVKAVMELHKKPYGVKNVKDGVEFFIKL